LPRRCSGRPTPHFPALTLTTKFRELRGRCAKPPEQDADDARSDPSDSLTGADASPDLRRGSLIRHAADPHGSAGEVSVVLQVATTSLALPAPSWTAAVESTSGSSPDKERRHLSAPDSAPLGLTGRAIHRPDAVAPPSPSGSALLGLPFAPANAPPRPEPRRPSGQRPIRIRTPRAYARGPLRPVSTTPGGDDHEHVLLLIRTSSEH
jgi:hypothetical protein